LSPIVRRSHTSILSWSRSLSFLFIDRSLKGKVRLLLIDDTRVEVGGREMVLFAAFESRLRRIVQYVEDRTEDFDDYISCRKGRCDKGHA
jgi:hypothetical protein